MVQSAWSCFNRWHTFAPRRPSYWILFGHYESWVYARARHFWTRMYERQSITIEYETGKRLSEQCFARWDVSSKVFHTQSNVHVWLGLSALLSFVGFYCIVLNVDFIYFGHVFFFLVRSFQQPCPTPLIGYEQFWHNINISDKKRHEIRICDKLTREIKVTFDRVKTLLDRRFVLHTLQHFSYWSNICKCVKHNDMLFVVVAAERKHSGKCGFFFCTNRRIQMSCVVQNGAHFNWAMSCQRLNGFD